VFPRGTGAGEEGTGYSAPFGEVQQDDCADGGDREECHFPDELGLGCEEKKVNGGNELFSAQCGKRRHAQDGAH